MEPTTEEPVVGTLGMMRVSQLTPGAIQSI